MINITQPPSLEESKVFGERMEKYGQLKARLVETRSKIVSTETTGDEKLELQKLLVAIEVEMAAHLAETNPDPVDPLKVVEEANARHQKKVDDRDAEDVAQKKAMDEMRENRHLGVAV